MYDLLLARTIRAENRLRLPNRSEVAVVSGLPRTAQRCDLRGDAVLGVVKTNSSIPQRVN